MHKLSLWAAWLPAFFCVTAAADPRFINAYVVNEGSASLSIIDTPTEKVTATVNFGERPRGLAVSSEGERAYVSLEDGTLVERDMFSRIESARAMLGGLAYSIDLSPDGKLLAAAVQNTAEVVLVELATMRIAKKIPIRSGKRPTNAVFSPDGRWIYVGAEETPAIDVVDVRQGAVATSITVGARLRDIAFTADGSRAYVAAEQPSEVAVIDVSARKRAEETQRRVDELASTNRHLQAEIVRRHAVETSLKTSERRALRSLDEARQLQKQLREMSHQLLMVEENQRKQISRELHDNICQLLVGINVRMLKSP